jgi:GBP family porin
MDKKLVVLAVASALAAPMVASADNTGVTLFGRLQAEYSSTRIDQASSASDYRQQVISDNAGQSRWGLLISEDLGNGLSANGKIEFSIKAGTGVADSAREQWVGIASKSWGALQFGRVQSPFKDFAGGLSIDLFSDTNLQGVGAGGAMYGPASGLGAGGFVDHALRYNSPEFSGFSAAVLLSPSNATQAESTTGGGNIGGKGGADNYQIGLKYKFGSAGEVFGGYSNDGASDAQRAVAAAASTNFRTADDEQVWRIGGAWNFGDFRIVGQYEDISNALSGNGGATCGGGARADAGGDAGLSTSQCNSALNTNGDGHIWFLSGQYKIGKTTLVLQGGKTTADQVTNPTTGVVTANERTAKNITVAAIYNFSKRTRVFGGYQRVTVDGAHTVDQVAAGSTSGTTVLATQPDRSTWEIGMRHDF